MPFVKRWARNNLLQREVRKLQEKATIRTQWDGYRVISESPAECWVVMSHDFGNGRISSVKARVADIRTIEDYGRLCETLETEAFRMLTVVNGYTWDEAYEMHKDSIGVIAIVSDEHIKEVWNDIPGDLVMRVGVMLPEPVGQLN